MRLPCLRRWLGAALLLAGGGLVARPAVAQDPSYVLTGTVVDAQSRAPLASAAVQIRGGSNATVLRTLTDASGRYQLRARVNAGTYTVQYSLIGRQTTTRSVTLGAAREVQLGPVGLTAAALELEELVVTGTGVAAERREVGNTVGTVSGEAISQAPGANSADQALQGKIAGAEISETSGQPGGGTSIRLRGTSTILGNAEPLIVVDGILVDNNNEALIGLGANAGRGNASLTNRLADIAPEDIERVEVLKGAAAAALYGSRANSGVIQIFTKRGRQGRPQINFRTELQASETNKRLPLNMEPLVGRADTIFDKSVRALIGQPVQRFDPQDQIFRTGYGTSNQLSVSGGSEGTTYYMSGNFSDEQGIIRPTAYQRYGARARVTQRLSDWLELGVNGNYLRTRTDLVPEGEQIQGILTTVLFTPTTFNSAFDPNTGRFPYSPVIGTNPLDVIENWQARTSINRFFGNVQVTATPLSNLTLTYLAGIDDGRQEDIYFQPRASTSPGFTGLLQTPVRSIRRFNNDITANLETQLSSPLGLTSTAGFRYTDDRTNTIRAAVSDLSPGQTTLVGSVQTATQGIVELRTLAGFLQERLAINNRLFLTAGLNAEASSAFGRDQRWQLFPRASGSWVVNEQPGFEEGALGRVFSSLRLRAAYGETGGQPPSEYLNQVTYLNVNYGGRPGLRPPTLSPNLNLKPERQRELEGGFDVGFLNDRLSAEFTYYDKRTTDLVLSVPLALTTGFESQFQNIGELSNRGIELSLNSANIQREQFSWTSRLIFSRNRNKIERLNPGSDSLFFDYLGAVIKGQPIGVFYGRVYPRDAQGNVQLLGPNRTPIAARDTAMVNGARVITIRRQIIGDPNPDFTASLLNNFNIRGLDVSMLLDGRFGNDVANFTRRSGDFFGSSPNAGKEARGDTVPGTFSRNFERNLLYEEFIEDGSFVKLRELALGYRFNSGFARRLGARDLGLRVAGRNLYTWTDYSGLDPEINLFAASTVSRGVDFATTPIPRTVAVSLDFNF